MGEALQPVTPRYNRSVRVECQEDRLTGEPGAVLLHEILESSGIVDWVRARLKDPRRQADGRPERPRAHHAKTRQTGHQPPICAEGCTEPPNSALDAALSSPDHLTSGA